MIESDNRRYGVGIIPRDVLTRGLLAGYRGPDARTAVFAVHSVSYSIYSSFIISNILFFFFYDSFFKMNLVSTIAACVICTGFSFFRFAFDKTYKLETLEAKRFLVEVFVAPVFIIIMYGALYLAAYDEMPHTHINVYFVFVILQSFVSGISAFVFSNLISNLLKLCRKFRL